MKKFILILCFPPFLINAQVFDDFSDGDFTNNPEWSGDTEQFEINDSKQLQLNSSGPGISYLSTANALISETEWQFWIELSFDPSANNNARVYLVSDQMNLEGDVNGYFLQFGESNSNDAIELFRQEGAELVSVCRGTEGLISSSFNLHIKIRRDNTGLWEIFTDPTGSGFFEPEASGTDNVFNSTAFLGVCCKYTSTNSTKFYFDDFYAGPFIIDTEPPEVILVDAVTKNNLDILFNEAVDEISAENIQNYFVDHNIECPVSALRDLTDFSIVHLTFDRSFQNGLEYIIAIQNISDIAGNIMQDSSFLFAWFVPSSFEVQINEIMADPSPVVGLPDCEYIELYNRTNLPVNLNNWKLIIGSQEKIITDILIEANGYLILADEDAQPFFINYGPFYGFSSLSLNNSGQTIILKNDTEAIIHTISYTDNWYKNPSKEDGGWSLEQIDPLNPCGEEENWKASENHDGGTPGSVNSVSAPNPDEISPGLKRVGIIDNYHIRVYFTEQMDSISLPGADKYEVDRNLGTPDSVFLVPPDYSSVILKMKIMLDTGVIYTLTVKDDLMDCVGNKIFQDTYVEFGIPEPVSENDIVINEVLYNPKDDFVVGVDFVEIYNRSDKIIDLKNLVLATVDDKTQQIVSVKYITDEGFLIFPGNYIVLTSNPETVKTQYFTSNPGGFIKMVSLPSYNNDTGVVVLATRGLEIIDSFSYYDEMQFPLLNSTDGVSLERINYDRPTNDPTNWHSAAEDVGYATPAYKNSQFTEFFEIEDPITVEPEIFSPDNDGVDDILNINYIFELPGYTATITIFDARGRLVRKLVNNVLLGTEGTFSWDGITDNNQKARMGIYIIFIEIFDLNGNPKKYKKTTVLGGKL